MPKKPHRVMRFYLRLRLGMFLLLAALTPVPTLGAQESLVRELAKIEDPSGQMSFQEVLTHTPQPYHGLLVCGYSPSVWWIRVTLAPMNPPMPVVLSVWPQFLDEIALFDPSAPAAPPRFAGDKHPVNAANTAFFSHAFFLGALGPEPREFWLRVRSESSILLSLSAMPIGSTDAAGRRAELFNDLCLGFLICLTLWAAVSATLQPDRLMWLFLLKQGVQFLYFIFLIGYARVWLAGTLSPEWINQITNFFVVSVGVVSMGFHYFFLKLHRGYRLPLRLLWVCLFWYPVEVALVFSGHSRFALHLRMILNLCAPFLLLAASLGVPDRIHLRRPHHCFSRNTLVAFYALMCVALLLVLLPFLNLGIWPNFVRYSFFVEGLLTGLGVMILIHWRSLRTGRLHARRGYKAMQLGKRLEAQRVRNQEQQHFISILAHELKTPLSVVRMSLASGAASTEMAKFADKAVVEMSGLIERCVNTLQLEVESPVVRREPCDAPAVCAELCARMEHRDRIRVSVGSDVSGFQTDVGLFRIILGNLLDNALKYGAPDAAVSVRFEGEFHQATRGLALVVDNTPGPAGFPDPERVFQKFYRSAGAHRSVGAGLGLFLVQGVTRLLGGAVRYARVEERVVFSVWLPW